MRRLLVVFAVLAACKGRAASGGEGGAPAVTPEGRAEAGPAVPFEVRADSGELMFCWFDERASGHDARAAGQKVLAHKVLEHT